MKRGWIIAFILIAGCLLAGTGRTADGDHAMNGFKLEQFKGFEKDWHLVTSRFRRDTGEMRITYANDIAWKALQEHSTDYPDGAIFGKIGMMTEEDPDFTSSAVPSGAKRYQFMVRDKAKFAETKGWGYAIFTPAGEPSFSKDDQAIESRACSACHEMVPHRGYVFSQAMPLPIGEASTPTGQRPAPKNLLTFQSVDAATLPDNIRKVLPEGFPQIRRAHGPLEKNIFMGTMGEIRPALIKEAMRTRVPAALVDDASGFFSLAYVNATAGECKADNGKKGLQIVSLFTMGKTTAKNPPLNKGEYCEPLP